VSRLSRVGLLPLLEEAGIRMRPMNRMYPNRWCTWIGDCAAFVAAGRHELQPARLNE